MKELKYYSHREFRGIQDYVKAKSIQREDILTITYRTEKAGKYLLIYWG